MAIPTFLPALEAQGLIKTFGEGPTAVRALRGVDICVAASEFVAIMGPSGSGKSTLLHICGALDRRTDGSVEIHGRRYDNLADRELTELRGETFGFIFQFFNLMPTRPPPRTCCCRRSWRASRLATTPTARTSCSRWWA